MSSVIWYLYEFARKGWVENFAGAATDREIVESPERFRDFPEVIRELCIACGACTAACPSPAAIRLVRTQDKEAENGEGITYPIINTDACIRCGFCAEVCPTDPKTLRTGEAHLIREEFTILPAEKMFVIDDYLCIRCKKCMKACQVEGAIKEEEGKMVIDQSKCIACGKCAEACPVKGAIKGIYIENVEGQKDVINIVIHSLEDFIESKQDELKGIPPEQVVKFEIPLEDLMEKARGMLPEEEHIKEIVERVVDRLKLRIITWDDSSCNNCRLCVDECPSGAITYDEEKGVQRDANKCLRCTTCYQTCPFGVAGAYVARFLLTSTELKEDSVIVNVKPAQLELGG